MRLFTVTVLIHLNSVASYYNVQLQGFNIYSTLYTLFRENPIELCTTIKIKGNFVVLIHLVTNNSPIMIALSKNPGTIMILILFWRQLSAAVSITYTIRHIWDSYSEHPIV